MSGILMASVGNSYGSAPVNTVAPVVSGTATVGQTLSTTNGTWTGAPAPTFTYQWQRTGVDIGGATSSTYVLVAADYANTIRCVVKATNSVAPSGVTANSNSTASVAGNAPVNTVAPAVTGTATVGQTLSTTNGTWTGVPTPTFTYQWQRVTTNISGATSSTYVLVDADGGSTIRCVVTATNAVSAVSANSNSTAAVAAVVPGAPTIGTATATGSSTATVAYTAPASNGGATITLYTATSSPGGLTGTLATSGSGTITVSGLSPSTSYTFTVKATNSAGQSAASAASNSITTTAATGQQVFTGTGTFTWIAPTGVSSVSALVIGRGGNGANAESYCCDGTRFYIGGGGGGGGGLAYQNNISVTAGTSYTVFLTVSGTSYFISTSFVRATSGGSGSAQSSGSAGAGINEGSIVGMTAGRGGNGSFDTAPVRSGGGGGGAAGYAGTVGTATAGSGGAQGSNAGGTPINGGSGGGGGASPNGSGGGGGGTGALGQGSVGANGTAGGVRGGGGSSGTGGGTTPTGGEYGGGGGGAGGAGSGGVTGGSGGSGVVRIIWPGTTRSYPSTNTGNL